MNREEIDALWAEADRIHAEVGDQWPFEPAFHRIITKIQDEYGKVNIESRTYREWSDPLKP